MSIVVLQAHHATHVAPQLRDAIAPPSLRDFRHSFALPLLCSYLGHTDPRNTYWYLTATPELLALAAQRLDSQGARA